MKNFLNLISICLLLILVSCQNEGTQQSNECAECKTAKFSIQKLKIGENIFNVRNYDVGTINDPDFLSINTSENRIAEAIKTLKSDFSLQNKVKGLILFSNYNGELKSIEKNIIDAFVIYEEKNNSFNTRIFKKINNYYVENKDSNLKTNFISTNDFKNISFSINNNVYRKTIAIINFKGLKIKNFQKSELQNKISDNIDVAGKSGSFCNKPCIEGADAFCTASESQSGGENWWCLADVRICINDNISDNPQEPESSIEEQKYKNDNTRTFLHEFRDNYLMVENNGEKYVNLYYSLSENIKYSLVTTTFVKDTFSIINSMRPKLENLLSNKNSNSIILIDNTTAEILIDYLSKYSFMFEDQESLNNIDFLIQKINEFKNKTNYYITQNL